MDNFLSGGIAELEQAKEAISNAAMLNEDLEETEKLLRSNEKDVDAQKKFMSDKIDASIRNRREELEKVYDDQIAEARRNLKAAERSKKNAKSKAVNEKVISATEHLNAENKKLNSQIQKMFREAKIPSFCNTAYYYALFDARTVKDFFIFAITVLMTIAVIPNVVCLLLNIPTVYKILIYVGIVLIFMLIYFLIFINTKGEEKSQVIDRARILRKRIRSNKKQIQSLSANIRNDSDESSYGLADYDAEIERCTALLSEKEQTKAAALEEFSNYTATSIRAEIENENLPLIEQLEAAGADLRSQLEQKRSAAQTANNQIANSYSAYLGAKNATESRVDELIGIISEGRAQTIMQALDILEKE